MTDVRIKFKREGLEGLVPIGTYIGDAMRRIGVPNCTHCDQAHDCVITVTKGEKLLSPRTSLETEHFGADESKPGQRLACHARIEKPGEIIVMTEEQAKEAKPEDDNSEEYRKQFTELPLDKKMAELVKLEAIALGETFSFILNSPYMVVDKVGDVMARFGMKLETKAREAQRPAEHMASKENQTDGEVASKADSEPVPKK